MHVSPFEPEVTRRQEEARSAHPGDRDAGPPKRASPDGQQEGPPVEEPIEEPGYGHGV
jgi:hypothetical protein